MEEKSKDNLMSAFSDGTLTPLEVLVAKEAMNLPEDMETLEIAADIKTMKQIIERTEHIRVPECAQYIERFRDKELPNNVDKGSNHHIF